MIFLCKCYHRNRACCSIFPSQGCILCIDCRSGNIDQVLIFFIYRRLGNLDHLLL